jgi:TRAP-type C4-dicarboxylate transport system permease small subunit
MQADDTGADPPPFVARLTRLNARLEVALGYLAGLCLAGFTAVVAVDVFFRQVMNNPLLWPSEYSVILFVWSVLLGASVATRQRAHFVVDVLPEQLPAWVDRALRIAVSLLGLLFSLVLLYFGLEMTEAGRRRFMPMMGYPMFYVFAAFPVAGLAITLFNVEQLLQTLRGSDAAAGDDGGAR